MKVSIISVGKLKEKYLKEGIAEYSKRLSRYCTIEMIEVADEKCPETLSEADQLIIKEKEAERISARIKDNSYIVTLEIGGKEFSSEKLASKIESITTGGQSHITFVIGGSLGLAGSITQKSNLALSFSPMTFPHQLMRLILLEQIYRSFRIIRNEPYHK